MAFGIQHGVLFSSPDIQNGKKIQAVIKSLQSDTITLVVKEKDIVIEPAMDITVYFQDQNATYFFETKAVTPKTTDGESFNIMRPSVINKSFNRTFPRVVVDIPVQIGQMDKRDVVKIKGKILDISGGGVLLQTVPSWNVGDLFKMTFELKFDEGTEKMEDVTGLVMWKKIIDNQTCRYGVEFNVLSEIRRNRIIAYVNAERKKRGEK